MRMAFGVCAVLSGLLLSASPVEAAKWLDQYGAALQQTQAEAVPLLVVLEMPTTRLQQVSLVTDSAEDALLKPYKLCKIDVSTEYGAKVAAAFAVQSFPHTVIIDKTASKQIYRKTGQFSKDEWTATLLKYQTGEVPARPASLSTKTMSTMNNSTFMNSNSGMIRRRTSSCPYCN